MLEKLRVGAAITFLVLFAVSVFTVYPQDAGTRTILGTLAVMTAGFLFGPTLLNKKKGNGDA